MSAFPRRAILFRLLSFPLAALAVLGVITSAAAQEAPPAPAVDAREVSLPELLAYAEEHAPAIAVSERRRGYADAARAEASPLLRSNPIVELGVGPRFNDERERDYDYVVALGQPVEIAGQRRRRLDAASRQRERLDAEATATRWEIRREIVLAYAAAVVARERSEVLDGIVRFADEMLAITQRRLEAGDVSAIDLRVAEADAALARQAALGADAHLRSARIRLAEVSGWAIETPPNVPPGLEAPRVVPALSAVMEVAEDEHPELRARRAAVAEAHARTRLARREGWPTPVVGVQVAREGATGGPANHVVLGTLGLAIPVWQRNQGERARARVDEEVALAEESATVRALRARIARAHVELVTASERLALFTSGIAPQLDESLSLLRRGFEAGELPLLTVAAARERFLAAQRDAIGAYADYYRALAELEYAIGAELPGATAAPAAGGAP